MDNFNFVEYWKCGFLKGVVINILVCNINFIKLDDNFYVLFIKVFKFMLLICKIVRVIRNFSIVFRNILIGVCMVVLDLMFYLKIFNLKKYIFYMWEGKVFIDGYLIMLYLGNFVIKKKSYYLKNFRLYDIVNMEIF